MSLETYEGDSGKLAHLFLHVRLHGEDGRLGSKLSSDTKYAGTLILDILSFRPTRNKCLCISHPTCDILL